MAEQIPLYPVDRIPVRSQREEFAQKTAELLTYVVQDHVPGINAATTLANEAIAASEAAIAAKDVAVAGANFKGNWSDLTGAINMPSSVAHDGKFWALAANLADVTLAEPGVDASWVEIVTGVDLDSIKFIMQPELYVEDAPTNVPENPTLMTNVFRTFAGDDVHQMTDWQVVDNTTTTVVWESLNNTHNLLSIKMTPGSLVESHEYTFRARHKGVAYGWSEWVETVATTQPEFSQYLDQHIGEARDGGFFTGRMNPGGGNIRYALITAPKASGESSTTRAWKSTTDATPGTLSQYHTWDGLRNTHAMTVASGTHAAGAYTWALNIGGKTDWYLPGADELEVQYRNCKPDLTANNTANGTLHGTNTSGFNPNSEPTGPVYTGIDPAQTSLTAYQTGGAEVFEATSYWSSSEFSAANAWRQAFSHGAQSNVSKVNAFLVRAVRRSILYPFNSSWFGDFISDQGGYWGGNIWDGVSVDGTLLTSGTSLEVGTGTKALTIAGTASLTSTHLWIGRKLRFVATGRNRSNAAWMQGKIVDVNTSTRVVTIDCERVLGSGTFSAWALVAGQALIVAPKSWGDVGTFTWKFENTAGPIETQTLTNGPAATAAMIALGAMTHPAAAQVAAMNAFDSGAGRGGFNDWYMPARDELHVIGFNLCPTLAGWDRSTARSPDVVYSRDGNIDDGGLYTEQTNWMSDPPAYASAIVPQTHSSVFKVGAAECFEATNYWSSSEYSATTAWFQNFSSGNQTNANKTSTYRVRAVRRLPI